MVSKQRVPMQVSPVFEQRIKKLQVEIMKKQGVKESLRDLTEKISKSPDFDELEKKLLNIGTMTDLNIKIDRRGNK